MALSGLLGAIRDSVSISAATQILMEQTGWFGKHDVGLAGEIGSISIATSGNYRLEFTYLKSVGGVMNDTQSAVYCATCAAGAISLTKVAGFSDISLEASGTTISFVSYFGTSCTLTIYWRWLKEIPP